MDQIRNRFTGEIMCGGLSLKVVLERHKNWLYSEGPASDRERADLRAADLSDANLRAANLRAADLSAANLRAANLRAANLRAANLRAADLRDADLKGVPFIANIHQAVYAAASQPEALDMQAWHHPCGTVHCRAGWVVHLAGDAGKAMEFCLGTPAAAALIYMKSDPKLERVPDFYTDNETALADMKRLAELEAAAA